MEQQASIAQRRYAEIMRDVEEIINDHSMSTANYFPGQKYKSFVSGVVLISSTQSNIRRSASQTDLS